MGARAAAPAVHRLSAPVRAAAPPAVLPPVQVRFASAKAPKDAVGVTPAPGQAGHAKMWAGVVKDCVAMPCTLAFATLKDVNLAKKKKVAIVGTKASLDALAKSGRLPKNLQESFELVVSKLKAKPLKIVTIKHLVSGEKTEELIVGCVTDVAGRNSSQHRGDQVRQFVKMVDAEASTGLVLAVPSAAGVFAYTSSAPKGHSLCDLKGENDGFKAKNRQTMQTAVWVATGEQVTQKQLASAQIVGESVQLAARLVDMPANYLNTKTYSQIAQGLAKRFGFDVNVIQGEQLQKQGMNVIFSVGRAAEYSSALVTCSYAPKKGKSQEVVCWAGKGVVYDTGGLSLKPGNAMAGMKRDMGGSASALGAFVAAVRLETTRPLHCLLGLADNAVSGASLRPDDIVRSLSGKTIEINNTDAEGRLVLCDTVAYAHKTFKPSTLVDLATLTGAQVCSHNTPCQTNHTTTGHCDGQALCGNYGQQGEH